MHPTLRKGPLCLQNTPHFPLFYKNTPPISFPPYGPVTFMCESLCTTVQRTAQHEEVLTVFPLNHQTNWDAVFLKNITELNELHSMQCIYNAV